MSGVDTCDHHNCDAPVAVVMTYMYGPGERRVCRDHDPLRRGPDHAVIGRGDGVRVVRNYGAITVSVDTDNSEHHATARARAARCVRSTLGDGWVVRAYLGPEHYRCVAGYARWARRYAVVNVSV